MFPTLFGSWEWRLSKTDNSFVFSKALYRIRNSLTVKRQCFFSQSFVRCLFFFSIFNVLWRWWIYKFECCRVMKILHLCTSGKKKLGNFFWENLIWFIVLSHSTLLFVQEHAFSGEKKKQQYIASGR